MSKDKEMQIIAANFETKDEAKLALEAFKKAKVKRGHAAILSKSAEGKVKVKDTFNWGVFAGSFGGAAIGVILLGILGGSAVFGAAAIGGVVGGIISKKKHPHFPTSELKNMAESLEPDHAMVVLLTDAADAAQVESILAESGGQHISHPLSAELVNEVGQALVEAEADNATADDEDAG